MTVPNHLVSPPNMVLIQLPPYAAFLTAFSPSFVNLGWNVMHGDLCQVVSYNALDNRYTLLHPAHPNEPFLCDGQYAIATTNYPKMQDPIPSGTVETTPVPRARPSTCTCAMAQLWKTGCICGHIERFVSKKL